MVRTCWKFWLGLFVCLTHFHQGLSLWIVDRDVSRFEMAPFPCPGRESSGCDWSSSPEVNDPELMSDVDEGSITLISDPGVQLSGVH
jgi:hypothetical protein